MSDAPDTTFKDLCVDVVDAGRMAEFWSEVLGLPIEERHGNVLLRDGVEEHTIWLNVVGEARTVKQRVHLDVNTDAVSRLVDSGATVLDTSLPWTVLTDPEGGELCAFVRAPEALTDYRLYEVVVDAAHPEAIAGWWARVFGLELQHEDEEWWVGPGAGLPWELVFGAVPEPKTVKNRIHWDVWGDTDTLLASGATLQRRRDDEINWDVLADPEGNEFCVFARD
ncbi:MAG TPA: VOC family protein [Microlunatus sp.]|nr:VOC family protein [Microlunatus sp.]